MAMGRTEIEGQCGIVDDIANDHAPRAAIAKLQRAGIDGGAAGIGIVVVQHQGAAAVLLHCAVARHHAGKGEDVAAVEHKVAVVGDIAGNRTRRTAIANLQRTRVDAGATGVGIGACQHSDTGAVLFHGPGTGYPASINVGIAAIELQLGQRGRQHGCPAEGTARTPIADLQRPAIESERIVAVVVDSVSQHQRASVVLAKAVRGPITADVVNIAGKRQGSSSVGEKVDGLRRGPIERRHPEVDIVCQGHIGSGSQIATTTVNDIVRLAGDCAGTERARRIDYDPGTVGDEGSTGVGIRAVDRRGTGMKPQPTRPGDRAIEGASRAVHKTASSGEYDVTAKRSASSQAAAIEGQIRRQVAKVALARNLQSATAQGGATAVGIDATQGQCAATLLDRAAAGNHSRIGRAHIAIENQGSVVADVAGNRATSVGGAIAQLQRTGANGCTAGVGVVARQHRGAGTALLQCAGT
ncbi:hypothetical protein D3C77_268720 [compost metagenome]